MLELTDLTHVEHGMEEVITQWRNSEDGGWPLDPPQLGVTSGPQSSDSLSTALVTFWLLGHNPKRYEATILKGLKFLAHKQRIAENVSAHKDADGGWPWRDGHPAHVITTCIALRAFIRYSQYARLNQSWSQAEQYLPNMLAARSWLMKHHKTNSGWSDLPNHPSSAPATCWAALAWWECQNLRDLQEPQIQDLLQEALDRVDTAKYKHGWVETLSQAHHKPSPLATACCTYLLCKLGEQSRAEDAIGWLLEEQKKPEGFWAPGVLESPVRTAAWAISALLAGGLTPTSATIEQGISYLLKMYGQKQGWPEKVAGPPAGETTMYCCLALGDYRKALAISEQLPSSSGSVVRAQIHSAE